MIDLDDTPVRNTSAVRRLMPSGDATPKAPASCGDGLQCAPAPGDRTASQHAASVLQAPPASMQRHASSSGSRVLDEGRMPTPGATTPAMPSGRRSWAQRLAPSLPGAPALVDVQVEAEAFRSSVGGAVKSAAPASSSSSPAAVASTGQGAAGSLGPVPVKSRAAAPAAVARSGRRTAPTFSSQDPVTQVQECALAGRRGQERACSQEGVEAADDAADERWFLGMGTKIVGVQHYDGLVSDRENVMLRRQPSNMYDRNAIQVLNMRNEQIGHIPREMAAQLAPLMDALGRRGRHLNEELRIEGHIPRGSGNVFSIPVRLQVFGRDPEGTLAPRIQKLGDRLQRTHCAAARGSVEVCRAPDDAGTPVDSMDDQMWRQLMGGQMPKRVAPQGPSMGEIMERELENIYRGGASYESAPEAAQPTALRTPLYPHQLKALHWMQMQERSLTVAEALAERLTEGTDAASAEVPSTGKRGRSGRPQAARPSQPQAFFWTREQPHHGGYVYKNLATNAAFREPPRLPRGGILADDMGLGKSITTLALLLSEMERSAPVAKSAAAGRNLIVCPLTVLHNWSEQIKLHAPSLRCRLYHGSDRDKDSRRFGLHDVTLTTYDTLRAEAADTSAGIGAVKWHRAVLDEAHVIKGHKTATARAVFDIVAAERRWCLTGTPIQNSVEDIYSLARFLRLEPFDKIEWFNRTISRPLKSRDIVGFERLQILLRTWCLRRTKGMSIRDPNTGAPRPLLLLPQKTLEVVQVPLDPGDRALYDKLFACVSKHVKELEEANRLGEGFTQILSLLTRLRQLCCSSSLLPQALIKELRSSGDSNTRVLEAAAATLGSDRVESLLRSLAEAQEDDCSICLEQGCNVVTRCGHVFHRKCLETSIRELGRGDAGQCPLCRGPVRKSELMEKPAELEVVEGDDLTASSSNATSSKIRALVSFLMQSIVDKHDPELGKPHKAVVFSQFTSVLSLVQAELQRHSVPFARLDGSMAHAQRVRALESFSGHAHVQVILCSLKAAGTGVNLTVADHVMLVDPWWNPAVEDQAFDRLHRLGQRRPVRAMRFVAERTVEERILAVQQQKREVVEGALVQRSRAELQALRLDMVASIFEPF